MYILWRLSLKELGLKKIVCYFFQKKELLDCMISLSVPPISMETPSRGQHFTLPSDLSIYHHIKPKGFFDPDSWVTNNTKFTLKVSIKYNLIKIKHQILSTIEFKLPTSVLLLFLGDTEHFCTFFRLSIGHQTKIYAKFQDTVLCASLILTFSTRGQTSTFFWLRKHSEPLRAANRQK